ncbi:hypothetical protein JAAARDRAFT_47456 [Jaapia argillacea MUCL 33604]|uniref:AB hydrolase-1 domain-containing protein n=1 Tax=Jaapia argillacea MUCL 33604 TaxID=933084 RepID=A0A067Q4I9_9AGAM|nr:hypothetical protein JAAARDRAFT_47456 [Jaapia argillacea MUCL 33604]
MPVATINEKGTQFFYEDSGIPAGSSVYTTVVILHGTSYHLGTFRRLIPYAAQHNLRLVLVNRRDYPGSSPTSPDELGKLASPDKDVQAEGMKDMGLEIAAFLEWYIKNQDVPRLSRSRVEGEHDSGGVSLLAWSSGNATSLPMLAHVDKLSEESKTFLAGYLRTFVIYDAPLYVLGIPDPPNLYHPLKDQSRPMEDRIPIFNTWVSSYYSHPSLSSRSLSGLSQYPPPNPLPSKIPTAARISPTEMSEITYPQAVLRAESFVRYLNPQVYHENMRRCVCDEEVGSVLGEWKVVQIWCKESILETAWGAFEVERMVEEYKKSGGKGREYEVREMDGNHFAHWDQPEETMRFFASVV